MLGAWDIRTGAAVLRTSTLDATGRITSDALGVMIYDTLGEGNIWVTLGGNIVRKLVIDLVLVKLPTSGCFGFS